MRFARESTEYYRDRLIQYDSSAEFPLENVPILTASELRGLVPPNSNKIVVGSGHDYTVFQSGGSTGIPKTTIFSHHELERLNLPNARGFFACGLSSQDRVADVWAVGSLYMTFVHINRMLQQYGCMNFPFSNHTAPDFIYTVMKLFRINCVTGLPSVILNLARQIESLGLSAINVDKIFYGGEHLYEADLKELETKLGVKQILAPGYGTVETWYLGYQCTRTETGVYHAHDDQVYIEIVNEDTGKHCSPGEVGMIYVTAIPRRLMPVVRYRVGDRACWLDERCVCGRTTPLFKLFGRGDDILRIGYDSVEYQAVQDAVLKVPGLLGSIQMEKQREQGRDRLVIRVETELPDINHAAAAATLEEQLCHARPAFRDLFSKGLAWPLKIEFIEPNALPRNERTGKLIRIVDAAMNSDNAIGDMLHRSTSRSANEG